MGGNTIAGLAEFLEAYPQMALRPSRGSQRVMKGDFAFVAEHETAGKIQDCFTLLVEIPPDFPKNPPKVTESGGRIPKSGDFHVNQTDGSLCLGSPLGVLMKLSEAPTLTGFAEKCLVPYLYAISHKLVHGGPLLFGELAHGTEGMLADYINIFRLKNPYQVREALRLLGMKKRLANKLPCPCECGLRTGKCKFNWRLRDFRHMVGRTWFRAQLQGWELRPQPPKVRPKKADKNPTPIL